MLNLSENVHQCLIKQRPLVLCLTNLVTMDFMANCLLALGASPIMSLDESELEDLIKISNVIYINIGTLDKHFTLLAEKACFLAKKYAKPLILDPVGVGASLSRMLLAQKIYPHASIIRGNASEIITLEKGNLAQSSGVDATKTVDQAEPFAINLATRLGKTVVVSGKNDFIASASRQTHFNFGSPLMTMITGMGCSYTAVIAAFQAVIEDSFEAAVHATLFFSLCGSLAAKQASTPGRFKTAFVDALYLADFKAMKEIFDAV